MLSSMSCLVLPVSRYWGRTIKRSSRI